MDTSVSAGRRYRSWPEALKREIVAASFAPGSSVARVARHYEVNANQVFTWRKRYRAGLPVGADGAGAAMLPMMITPDRAGDRSATIEIELVSGHRVRVGAGVDDVLLRRVLDVLERR